MHGDTIIFYFIKVDLLIQVEHTVFEEVTSIDIAKGQIRILEEEGWGPGLRCS